MGEGVPEAALERILVIASSVAGLDFSVYRTGTLARRVRHRMATLGMAEAVAYADHVEKNEEERRRLVDVLLVKWTSMFREQGTFSALRGSALPRCLEARFRRSELGRAWVPACATGEDAFSLGMCLLEGSRRLGRPFAWSLVASDVNREALSAAEAGVVTRSGWEATPAELRDEFLRPAGEHWVLVDTLREIIGTEWHDVVASKYVAPRIAVVPHFDLILCRNLTIYLTSAARDRLFDRLLKVMGKGSLLVLGHNESVPRSVAQSLTRDKSEAPIYWVG
jgi:two-component system, chemotaxis family, CheB/CheR fusion protein